ncbi:MAG: hypothetical protein M0R03_22195 [Novosphingobium sp.]|nr:hypothetical protein [Novosphingobium sp.]
MKYIIKIENFKLNESSKYKHINYILINGASGNNIFLLSVLHETEKDYYGVLNYIFTKEKGYKKKKYDNKNYNFYNKNVIDESTLFKSNNIEECFSYMNLYSASKKYNL